MCRHDAASEHSILIPYQATCSTVEYTIEIEIDQNFDYNNDVKPIRPREERQMSRLYYPQPSTTGRLASGRSGYSDFAEKVTKLIPSEIISGYLLLTGFVPLIRNLSLHFWFYTGIFLLCLILTPMYLNYLAESGKPKRIHLVVSSLAFIVWAYAVSGSAVIPNYHDAAIASIILVAFTLATGFIPLD
jgi:hypothetical protein